MFLHVNMFHNMSKKIILIIFDTCIRNKNHKENKKRIILVLINKQQL